jgi:predicted nucleotidyltransferase
MAERLVCARATLARVFTVEERDAVRGRILWLAREDARVVAAAEVGSLAIGEGDEWSDLDLTFGVAEGERIEDVLGDFTRLLVERLAAAQLFDLPVGETIYRVFLLRSSLQVDLSFSPASSFGAHSPRFRLLFGEAVEKPHLAPPDARATFGWAAHDAVRARFCVERGLPLQAEFLIGDVRNKAMTLACLRRGLRASYGKGLDELPARVRRSFEATLVRSLEREELLRALGAAVELLLREAGDAAALAVQVEPQLREAAGGR